VYNSSSKSHYPISGAPTQDPQLVNNNQFYPDSYQTKTKQPPATTLTKERKPFTFYNHAGISVPTAAAAAHSSNIAAHH
jgi:hypothetical protein